MTIWWFLLLLIFKIKKITFVGSGAREHAAHFQSDVKRIFIYFSGPSMTLLDQSSRWRVSRFHFALRKSSNLDNSAWRHFQEILEKIQSEQLSFQSPIIDRWTVASSRKKLNIFSIICVCVNGKSENRSLIGTVFFSRNNTLAKIWSINFSGFNFIRRAPFSRLSMSMNFPVNDNWESCLIFNRTATNISCRLHAVAIP